MTLQAHKIAFLFPGQGSQYPGMGKDFAAAYPEARQTFEEAEDLLGRKLTSFIFEGPEDVLTETRNSQVAIYVMSIAILRVVNRLFPDLIPAVCGGLSLGEYTALTAAGKLPFSSALPLVQWRGQYMHDACQVTQGAMAVVLGLSGLEVENIVHNLRMPEALWIANFNAPGQIVISGTLKGVEAAKTALLEGGAKRVLPLQVAGAFHSGLMQHAEEKLAPHILQAPFVENRTEFVMNVPGDFVREIPQMRQALIQQVTHSVRWEQGTRAMAQSGVDLFIEMGCGKTLAGLNKRIGMVAPTISVEKVEDLRQLETLF